jgi:hypothetical protein
MDQLSWSTVNPEAKSEVFTQSTPEPDMVAELVAVLATDMVVVAVAVPDEADVPVTLSMVLTYQIRIAVLLHKNGRPYAPTMAALLFYK